jgi:putative tryptophan/tyrosine transport system substrate-binding protein
MRRREFISGLVAAAISSPARGQQAPKRMPRVGVLIGFAEQDPATQRFVGAFVRSLSDLGWIVGRNISIDFRYGAGNAEKNQALAKELVAFGPDVIFVNSTSATLAVQGATNTIPVVFATVSDPVGSGIVASLARPSPDL